MANPELSISLHLLPNSIFILILNREFPQKSTNVLFINRNPVLVKKKKKVLLQKVNMHPMNRLTYPEASSNGA